MSDDLVHEVFVTDPETKELHSMGFSIKTEIQKYPDPDCSVAEHTICNVQSCSVANDLNFSDGNLLLKLNNIKTDGMDQTAMVAQFKAIDISDITMHLQKRGSDPNQVTVVNVKLDVLTQEEKQNLQISCKCEEKQITPRKPRLAFCRRNSVSSLSVTESDVSGCGIEDLTSSIRVVHPKQVDICHIEHPQSQMYMQIEDGKLIMSSITSTSPRDSMLRSMFGGYEEVDSSPERVVIFTFRETAAENTLYITATSESTVGLQDIDVIPRDVQILNTDDPRLFYHGFAGNQSFFRSTAVRDHYLSCCEGQVKLKQVEPKNVSTDIDIQFVLRYES